MIRNKAWWDEWGHITYYLYVCITNYHLNKTGFSSIAFLYSILLNVSPEELCSYTKRWKFCNSNVAEKISTFQIINWGSTQGLKQFDPILIMLIHFSVLLMAKYWRAAWSLELSHLDSTGIYEAISVSVRFCCVTTECQWHMTRALITKISFANVKQWWSVFWDIFGLYIFS